MGVATALLLSLALGAHVYAGGGGGASGGACPTLVLAPALVKVRDAKPWCGEPGAAAVGTRTSPLRIAAARNEYESFQVVVNAPGATLTALALRSTRLLNTLWRGACVCMCVCARVFLLTC